MYKYCPLCKSALSPDQLGYNACTNQACNFVHYDNPTPVAAAVIEYPAGHVLLAHNVSWPMQFYGLITGFVEKGENPDETVLREVTEEVGLDGYIEKFIGHYKFERMNQIIIAYHIIATGAVQLNDELDDYRCVPFDKVKYWDAGTGFALRDLLVEKGFQPEMISLRK